MVKYVSKTNPRQEKANMIKFDDIFDLELLLGVSSDNIGFIYSDLNDYYKIVEINTSKTIGYYFTMED